MIGWSLYGVKDSRKNLRGKEISMGRKRRQEKNSQWMEFIPTSSHRRSTTRIYRTYHDQFPLSPVSLIPLSSPLPSWSDVFFTKYFSAFRPSGFTTWMGSYQNMKDATKFLVEHRTVPVVSHMLNGVESAEEGFELLKKGDQFDKVVISLHPIGVQAKLWTWPQVNNCMVYLHFSPRVSTIHNCPC